MTTTNPVPVDYLKYAAALLRKSVEWTTDTIGGDCDHDHEVEIDAILDTADKITLLAAEFGDPRVYSDGRAVMTRKEIQRGLVTEVVWHPNPRHDACRVWSACLPSDPGSPSPGVYTVSTHPARQRIDVRIVKPELENSGS